MSYNSAAWTGRYPVRHFPVFEFLLMTPWFGIRIGQMVNWATYGLALSWGYVPPAPYVATHRHYRSWAWLTAEQMQNRR